ncbi:hypothetical protein EDC01DRAFT_663157 [Geopyxis carbonaria]|nr:hypothetical protein EDC01DRAFT_663157 [Geopyxis carbonaria]
MSASRVCLLFLRMVEILLMLMLFLVEMLLMLELKVESRDSIGNGHPAVIAVSGRSELHGEVEIYSHGWNSKLPISANYTMKLVISHPRHSCQLLDGSR